MTEEEKEATEKLAKAYYSTFHSVEGQVVLEDLLNKFYRATSLSPDSNTTIANEGKRFVVIYLLAQMESVSKQPEEGGR